MEFLKPNNPVINKFSLKNISITTQVFIGFVIVTVCVLLSIFISYYNSNRIIKSADWVLHTQEVLTQLGNIEALLVDLETGQRGFLITGKIEYLEPFIEGKKRIYQEISSIRKLTSDNINQTQRIDSLKLVVDKKIEELDLTIYLRKNKGYEAAKEIVNNDSGKLFMDEIRMLLSDIEAEELRLLKIRSPEPEQIKETTNYLLIGLFGFTLIIISIVFTYIYRSIRIPIQKLQVGLEHIGKGNLDYTFEIQKANEFGNLAQFIESVLLELKTTIVSKEELETEIIIRKEVENDLTNIKNNLENRNKELEQFTYITSHDLQEPLNSIISFSNFLIKEKDKMSEIGQKSIEVITESSFRMRALIKELLEYTKIGKKSYQKEIDVEKIIVDLKTDLHSLIQEKQACITYKGKPLKVNGYKLDLINLFQNLIVNSLKFSKEKTPPIITINAEEQTNEYKFWISDNGIGIEEKYFDKIFMIFQKLHRHDEYSGTGIGLAYCQKVIDMHKGKIWMESKIGEGTTVFFTIAK
ncbi:CHASE3 domain-containing protein [Flammeovirga yaeyamensis]|uniref:histidine kinase n=1 Tax=Flammeovirga yaeyamensis TaxID=367791 RepID=A0AAX1NEU5_9BACT|nr:CHASE3 domain-containing protein [Flammeovirga yaeyamensis]MBB3697055.1 CHASE3 domain sensor protein [Flammeovirga yaeyamensis]NMF33717.1 hypothetical protein [Flammeovirga yaeyamensis]QWG05017.1 CHASE3 domain-containing protein [Flammeovirga yaeyamensis]